MKLPNRAEGIKKQLILFLDSFVLTRARSCASDINSIDLKQFIYITPKSTVAYFLETAYATQTKKRSSRLMADIPILCIQFLSRIYY